MDSPATGSGVRLMNVVVAPGTDADALYQAFRVSAEQLRDAHNRDLAIQDDETVVYERAWLDPEAGKVFCLATGPSKEAVMRIHQRAGHPTPEVYEIMAEV